VRQGGRGRGEPDIKKGAGDGYGGGMGSREKAGELGVRVERVGRHRAGRG